MTWTKRGRYPGPGAEADVDMMVAQLSVGRPCERCCSTPQPAYGAPGAVAMLAGVEDNEPPARLDVRPPEGRAMYFILGVVWLLGAIALFSYEWRTGDTRWRFLGDRVSSAWIMVVFAVYNFAQWWARRAQQAELEALRREH